MSQRGTPTPDPYASNSPWFWVGLVVASLVGLAYGWGHIQVTCAPYDDPGQGSPALVAMLLFFVGISVFLVVVPIVLAVAYWFTLGRTGVHPFIGCATLMLVALAGYFAAWLVQGLLFGDVTGCYLWR